MKATRILLLSLMTLALLASGAMAQTISGDCSGIAISAVQESGNFFTYYVTINNGATFTPSGGQATAITDVLGFSVNPGTGITSSPPIFLTPNWQYQVVPGGFGLSTPQTFTGITPPTQPDSATVARIATLELSGVPTSQSALVAVRTAEFIGFCEVPVGNNPCPVFPVIPEPGTLALLGMGLVPLAGLIRRRIN